MVTWRIPAPTSMTSVVFESVAKTFRHRPALFNWLGRERSEPTQALMDVSLEIAQGTTLALLGPNGSGKTTTLKLIATTLLPDRGRVTVEGADTQIDASRVRRNVGFAVATERSFYPRLSARENLEFFAALEDVPRALRRDAIEQVLEQTGLGEAGSMLVMKFSSGMYQRLGIARALIKKPSVLLFDEPTRSLDPGSALRFWDLVRDLSRQGTTVVVATHNFNEAVALGDVVAVLHRGRLAAQRMITPRTSVDDLRRFYFETTGEWEEVPEVSAGVAV
jgi:ABC-2 type transport system ATP-binding protein